MEACHNKEQKKKLEDLENMVIREHNDFYTIEDLLTSEENVLEKEVNLLFAIRDVSNFCNARIFKSF